jgi:DNA processing protein
LVVVEAQVRSGAMSSVSYANKVGIEVCVVPGSINSPLSDGCHALIRDGATLVTSTQDIINIVLPTIKMQQTQAQFAYEPSV